MLADQGLLANGRWVGSDDADVEIPVTLQALLAARLDRLDPVPRLILERASVEGRRFRIAALRALAPEVAPTRSRVRSPRSRGRVSCSRRTRPAVDGASRTRSSSRPRIEASPRSGERICTNVSPTG